MPTKSQLLLPPKQLASCIAGCMIRDTRTMELSDQERLNFFPASPLFTATLTLEGQIHIGDTIARPEDLRDAPPAEKWLFQKPRVEPHTSWNPGPVFALTLAFYPEAWQRLGGSLDGAPPPRILPVLALLETEPLENTWPAFWDAFSLVWTNSRSVDRMLEWPGSDRIKDWAHHLLGKVSQTEAGASLRSAQRRLLRWTGQNRRALEFFAKVEELHRLQVTDPDATPAELAADAGFADQSHMGRMLKRATGFSPVILNQKIASEEAFWCYRLLGQRF